MMRHTDRDRSKGCKGLRPATGTTDDRHTQRDPGHKEQPTKRLPPSINQRKPQRSVLCADRGVDHHLIVLLVQFAGSDKSCRTFVIIIDLRVSTSFDADSLAFFKAVTVAAFPASPYF